MTRSNRPLWVALLCYLLGVSQPVQAQVPWQLYHKTADLLQSLEAAAAKLPSLVKHTVLKDPESDATLPLFTVTNHTSEPARKEVVFIVAGEHPRELITSEIAFWLVKLLIQQAPELEGWPATSHVQELGKSPPLAEWGSALLNKVVFKVLPVVNIAGRKAVESGNLCLRKTLSGVDLNRNWPYRWVSKSDENADEYGGPAALSEPESRIVKLVAEAERPQAYVTMHSGEYALYVPWDSEKALAPNLPEGMDDLLDRMNLYCQCMHGSGGEVAGYLAFGTSMDYMYSDLLVPYPLTVEVYGPDGLGTLSQGGHPRRRLLQQAHADSPKNDAEAKCFTDFNPVTTEEYQSAVATWVGALLALADHLTEGGKVDSSSDQMLPEVDHRRDLSPGAVVQEEPDQDEERKKPVISSDVEAAVAPRINVPVLIGVTMLASCCFGVWVKIGKPVPCGPRRRAHGQQAARRAQPRYQQV